MKVSDPTLIPPEHWRPGVETRMVVSARNGATPDTVDRLGEMVPATMLKGVLVAEVRPDAVAVRV